MALPLTTNHLLLEWIEDRDKDLTNIVTTTKEIDEKQMFEKDDEVGIIFKQITDLIYQLKHKTWQLNESTEKQE